MKNLINFLFLFFFVSNSLIAQKVNSYLFKKDPTSSHNAYVSDPNFIGYWNESGSGLREAKMYSTDYEAMNVYIDLIDAKKAKISLADTSLFQYNSLNNKRLAYCVISHLAFFLPPIFTTYQHVQSEYIDETSEKKDKSYTSNYLFGQKLKNGNWQALSFNVRNINTQYKLPENKDYRILGPDMIQFQTIDNKYGVMDFTGKIIIEAIYDSCLTKIPYMEYKSDENKNKIKKYNSGNQNDIYLSFQEYFENKKYRYFETKTITYVLTKNSNIPIYLLKNKEASILVSAKYITRPIKNAIISKHDNGKEGFYFLHGRNDDYDIISSYYGDKLDEKYKYAYFESIRCDTTNGISSSWKLLDNVDYSKPVKSINIDSVLIAEARIKEIEEKNRIVKPVYKTEKIKYFESITDNNANKITGYYDKILIKEFNEIYYGINDTLNEVLVISTIDQNQVQIGLFFKGRSKLQKDKEGFYKFLFNAIVYKNEQNQKFIIKPIPGQQHLLHGLQDFEGSYDPANSELYFDITKQYSKINIQAKKRTNIQNQENGNQQNTKPGSNGSIAYQVSGNYKEIKFNRAGFDYIIKDALFGIHVKDANTVHISFSFEGKSDPYAGSAYSYKIDGDVPVLSGVIQGHSTGISGTDVKGVVFPEQNYSKKMYEEGNIKTFSGYFNPQTQEIVLTAYCFDGNTVIIKAIKNYTYNYTY